MSETQRGITERISDWNTNGRLDVIGGAITVLLAWTLFAPAGLLSIWIGYRLYAKHKKTIAGAVVGIIGGFGLLIWLLFITGTIQPA